MPLELAQPELRPVTVWHNPDCSKSRRALELLQGLGWVHLIVRRYLDDPPQADEIRAVLAMLAKSDRPVTSARGMMRAGEPEFAAHQLGDETRTEDELIVAMARFPVLIERPIVICGTRAVVGRPDYRALEVLRPDGEIPPLHEVMKSKIKEEGI